MTEPHTPNPSPERHVVGKGLAGMNIDTAKMSPETLRLYQDMRDIASDDTPGPGHEKALQAAEHAFRGAYNRDLLVEELKENGIQPPKQA